MPPPSTDFRSDFQPASQASLLAWGNLRCSLTWVYTGSPGQPQGQSQGRGLYAWRMTRGAVRVAVGGRSLTVPAGRWVLLPSGPTTRHFEAGAELLSVSFQARWIDGSPLWAFDQPLLLPESANAALSVAAEALLERVDADFPQAYLYLAMARTDVARYWQLQKCVLDWVLALQPALEACGVSPRAMGQVDERALRARERIDQSALTHPLSEAALAKAVGLSVSQLNRLFVTAFDQTPRHYSDQQRYQAARRLLQSSAIPIKQLGYQMGFKHPSYFSNWFRQHSGQSPRDFRQQELRPSQVE